MIPPLRPVTYHEPGRYFWISDSCVFLKVVGSSQTIKPFSGKRYKRARASTHQKRGGEVAPSPFTFLLLSDASIVSLFFLKK